MSVIVTNLESEESYELPVEFDIEEYIDREKGTDLDEDDDSTEITLEASFDVTDIGIGGQVVWDKEIDYACVAANANIEQNISAKIEVEELPLFEIPVPLGSGFIWVELRFSLVISATGEITINVETPMGIHLLYDREIGIRNIPVEQEYKEPRIEIASETEIAFGAQAILKAFPGKEILDVKVATGATASAELIEYDTQTCVDANIAFPTLTLSALNEDTKLGELLEPLEWEIITEENAKFKLHKHFETYSDTTKESQFVDECTYKESADDGSINSENKEKTGIERFYGYDLPLEFWLDYIEYEYYREFNITEEGDYYLVKGTLICPEYVPTDIDTETGKTFMSGTGFEYTVLGEESYNNDQRQKILLEGEDGNKYEITNLPAFNYDIYTSESYYVITTEKGSHIQTHYEDVVLRIHKDVCFTDWYDGSKTDTTFKYAVDNGWFRDEEGIGRGYNIHFTEDGELDILASTDGFSNNVIEQFNPDLMLRRKKSLK